MKPIKDVNTNLIINIKQDDSQKIVSAVFSGPQKTLTIINMQLNFFEATTYDAGNCLIVGKQKQSDGSIRITSNVKEALLFIAENNIADLSSRTCDSLKQVCSTEGTIMPAEQSSGKYFFGIIPQTLFHRRVDPAQTALLPNASPQIPV